MDSSLALRSQTSPVAGDHRGMALCLGDIGSQAGPELPHPLPPDPREPRRAWQVDLGFCNLESISLTIFISVLHSVTLTRRICLLLLS